MRPSLVGPLPSLRFSFLVARSMDCDGLRASLLAPLFTAPWMQPALALEGFLLMMVLMPAVKLLSGVVCIVDVILTFILLLKILMFRLFWMTVSMRVKALGLPLSLIFLKSPHPMSLALPFRLRDLSDFFMIHHAVVLTCLLLVMIFPPFPDIIKERGSLEPLLRGLWMWLLLISFSTYLPFSCMSFMLLEGVQFAIRSLLQPWRGQTAMPGSSSLCMDVHLVDVLFMPQKRLFVNADLLGSLCSICFS